MSSHFERIADHLYPSARLKGSQRLTGGVSADVFRLDLLLPDQRETSVVMRSHGETHGGHTADLEFELLQALHVAGLPVPAPLMVDSSGNLQADPFLVIAFMEGSTQIPTGREDAHFRQMADTLFSIHQTPLEGLPELPPRTDPLPEVFDFLPEASEFDALRRFLETLENTASNGTHRLLHGDFWPENLLWQEDRITCVLDWEDAAVGDPLSDVASCRVELRYRYGTPAMDAFTRAYARHHAVDTRRLALWQIYTAAAAHKYMGFWGLPVEQEAHMRREALASVQEAGELLMSQHHDER